MNSLDTIFTTKLNQDPMVASIKSKQRPYGMKDTLRCAIGLIDDYGECQTVLVRDGDPCDVADHLVYWPSTISDRWRVSRGGVMIGAKAVIDDRKTIILEAVSSRVRDLAKSLIDTQPQE